MAEKENNIITSEPECFGEDGQKVRCQSLVVHGTKYKTTLTTKYKNRKKWVKPNPNHEINFIPGTILNLFVKEGDQVKEGEPVLILEAMKMENTIYAPFDTGIKNINVKIGDVIPKGTLMVEYE